MKALAPILVLMFSLSLGGAAGSEAIIKGRAKAIRDQNNAQQGVAPPATPQPPPVQRVGPAPPDPTRASLGRFSGGLAAIRQGVPITAEQKQKLIKELTASAGGAKKPKPATVEELINNLTVAFMEKPLGAQARARLVQDLDGLLNPARYPQAKPAAITDDIQSIFLSNGLERTRASVIGELARSLSTEVR